MKASKAIEWLVIVLLVLISCFVVITVFKRARQTKRNIKTIDEQQLLINMIYDDYIVIDNDYLFEVMSNLGYSNLGEYPYLVMLVPPDFCPACLERENEELFIFAEREDIECFVCTSKRSQRDATAFFRELHNVTVFPYEADNFDNTIIQDKIVFFIVFNENDKKVFISSRYSGSSSSKYFDRISEILSRSR